MSDEILYDADCAFCRWSLALILRWDRGRRLRPVALQDPEAERLLEGMSEQERMASWHLIAEDGTVSSAGAAVAPLLRLLPGGRPVAAVALRFPGATDRAYRWVANNRGGLSTIVRSRREGGADD
jgi:predicted DCC family thiol-disulfide oxidoreductase YuxK